MEIETNSSNGNVGRRQVPPAAIKLLTPKEAAQLLKISEFLAGEGPDAGRRPPVHQGWSRHSLQRDGTLAVDASAPALVHQRTVKERGRRIKSNDYTSVNTSKYERQLKLGSFTNETDFYLLATLS